MLSVEGSCRMQWRPPRADVMLNITRILERQLLTWNLVHDPFTVVITEASTQLVVVHLRFVLSGAPELGDLFGLEDPKLVAISGPHDHVRLVRGEEEVQEELPELDWSTACRDWRGEERDGEGEESKKEGEEEGGEGEDEKVRARKEESKRKCSWEEREDRQGGSSLPKLAV